jgi:hypothetical protein
LGTVSYANGQFLKLDLTRRALASSRIADGMVTASKLSPELRSGWVRLPFKPSRFSDDPQAREFVITATRARSFAGAKGAKDDPGTKGTMSIPVPMFATGLKRFLIAGGINESGISIELHRCGWNEDNKTQEDESYFGDKGGEILESPFYKRWEPNLTLDPMHHALALLVHAKGESEIWLIAAEFEWGSDTAPPGYRL